MASSKRIGFFWGEEKITAVEFERDAPVQVISSSFGSKSNTPAPFSSSLNEEIQVTTVLQKMLQDNRMTGAPFHVSLPMKEIVLRSFIIPFVKKDEMQNVIKFEAKKYVPFDIQDMAFVYHTIPVNEGPSKNLQVIFFAVRKETLARYERIFSHAKGAVTFCEPYMVSLSKALIFRKEIKPTDNLAFLILEKDSGSICFIDQGIPQFIREFPIRVPSQSEETGEPSEALNSKILNEVGNSFDFYARQFNGDRIEQMLVSSQFVQKDLLSSLETELKLKLRSFSPIITTGVAGQSNDIDAIYAMGACLAPTITSLSSFNFLEDRTQKSRLNSGVTLDWDSYKEIIVGLLLAVFFLVGVYIFLQLQLKSAQQQYAQLSAQEGAEVNTPLGSIEADVQQNTAKLTTYKSIRLKSDVALILLRIASHLPKGVLLSQFDVKYSQADPSVAQVTIDIRGDVLAKDLGEQVAVVNQVFSDFKNDKELFQFIKNVDMSSLNIEELNGQKVTGFSIHCS